MQTRDQLLQGLNRAVELMRSTVNLQAEWNQIRGQYVPQAPPAPHTSPSKYILIVLGITVALNICQAGNLIAILFFWTGRQIASVISLAATVGLGFLIALPIRKALDKSIDKKNQQLVGLNANAAARNQALAARSQEIERQLQMVNAAYTQEVAPWYPPAYCYVDAAEFLLQAVQNYRADTMKEAMNLYEDTMHKNRMEQAQQESLKQQKLNNLLTAGVAVANVLNTVAVNRNTAAVQEGASSIRSAINSHTRAIGNNTDAVNNVANAIHRLRR